MSIYSIGPITLGDVRTYPLASRKSQVIKVGLGPVLIDLMKRGFVSGIAMNGAALIHDFEIALAGNTSEDVAAGLGEGQFGMAEETGKYLNEIDKLSHRIRIGYGEGA